MKYIAISKYDEVADIADSIEDLLETLKDDDIDPAEITFYQAVEGKYVPPSTPGTVIFGDR